MLVARSILKISAWWLQSHKLVFAQFLSTIFRLTCSEFLEWRYFYSASVKHGQILERPACGLRNAKTNRGTHQLTWIQKAKFVAMECSLWMLENFIIFFCNILGLTIDSNALKWSPPKRQLNTKQKKLWAHQVSNYRIYAYIKPLLMTDHFKIKWPNEKVSPAFLSFPIEL